MRTELTPKGASAICGDASTAMLFSNHVMMSIQCSTVQISCRSSSMERNDAADTASRFGSRMMQDDPKRTGRQGPY